MNFPCPKCTATTEFDTIHIPEEGASAKCPECKTRFWIASESFARRALQKESKPLCSSCSHELGHYLDCPNCGAMYPDVCVVQLSKPVARKQRKTSAAIGFSLQPQRKARSFTQQPTVKSSKTLLTAIVIVVAMALAGAAIGIPYFNHKAEQAYAGNIFRALYGIKLGTDLNFKQCESVAATARTTGRNLNLLITDQDKSRLESAKSDVDILMKRIPKPPEKYAGINNNLTRLYEIYGKSFVLASSPSGPLPAYADSTAGLKNEFRQAGTEFKGNMPAGLSEEFKQAVQKYKQLEDL